MTPVDMTSIDRRSFIAGTVALAATAAIPAAAAAQGASRVVLITGCSSGFGRLAAEAFAREGWRTFATLREAGARNRHVAAELEALASSEGLALEALDLDVTQEASVTGAVERILAATGGRIDVAINNAGLGTSGPLELHTPERLAAQFDTNLLGPHRVARAVLPAMRDRGEGLLLQVSSGLGRVVNPVMGSYGATKWAMEGMAESLRYELAPFGIDVCLVEPGPYPTRFAENTAANHAGMMDVLAPADRTRAEAYGRHLAATQALAEAPRPGDAMDVVRVLLALANADRANRPLRTVVAGPAGQPLEALNAAQGQLQAGFLQAMGMDDWVA